MRDRRLSAWLVWIATGVFLLPPMAAELGLSAMLPLPVADSTSEANLAMFGLAITAGAAVPLILWIPIEYWCEERTRPPLGLWVSLVAAGVLLLGPACLLTWPAGGQGAIPLLVTSFAATVLALAVALPLCLVDVFVKRARWRGVLGALIAVGSWDLSNLLFWWIAEWRHLAVRG